MSTYEIVSRPVAALLLFVAPALLALGCADKDPRYHIVSPSSSSTTSTGATPAPGGVATATSSTTASTTSSATAPATSTVVAPPALVAQAGAGGLSVPPTAAPVAPLRPITIGEGPVVARTARGDVKEHLREWTAGDLRALDPIDARFAGDGLRDSREVVAFYTRREAGKLHLRIDMLDLRYGAELGGLDLVVLVGWSGAGATALPLGLRDTTAHAWDAALVIEDTATLALLDRGRAPVPGVALELSMRADLDAIEAAIPQAALSALGWTGQPFTFQVLAVRDGEQRVDDAVLEVDTLDRRLDECVREGWVAPRRALLAPVAVANRAALQASTLVDLVYSRRTTTSEGRPTGLRRTLESHVAHGLPLTVHASGALVSAIGWARAQDPLQDGPTFLRDLSALWDGDPSNGVGGFVPGTWADAILPYVEGAPTTRGAALADEVYRERLGVTAPGRIHWIAERVAQGSTLAQVRALGFTHTVLDRNHLRSWTGTAPTDGKLHRIDGVTCFVIDPTVNLFAQTDGGPDIKLRTLLVERALSSDPDQVAVAVADFEEYAGHKGNSDVPDAWDRTLEWLAQRPWIEVTTLEAVAARNPTVTDHGAPAAMPVQTWDWLQHASSDSYDHWVFGHPFEEAFTSVRPVVRNGRPFTRTLGLPSLPGTLLGDAWSAIEQAPAGELRDTAERALLHALYRTGWHVEDMHDTTRLANGAWLAPDVTFDKLTAFGHALATHAGEAALPARAARWAAAPPASPRVLLEDADLDGEDELLLCDDRALFVVEREGGRVVASFARDAATGAAFQVSGAPHSFPEQSPEAGWESPGFDAPRNSVLKDVWAAGAGREYVNDASVAVVSTTSAAITITSSDGLLRKTLALSGPGRLEVTYDLDPSLGTLWVRAGLSPDLGALLRTGQDGLTESDAGGVYRLTKRTTTGATTRDVSVAIGYADAGHSARRNALASDGGVTSPRTTAFQHLVELSGDAPGFSFSITLEAR